MQRDLTVDVAFILSGMEPQEPPQRDLRCHWCEQPIDRGEHGRLISDDFGNLTIHCDSQDAHRQDLHVTWLPSPSKLTH